MKRNRRAPATDLPEVDTLDVGPILDRLERAIRYSDGLTLAFVKCNSPAQRREMSAALLLRLPDLRVLEIELERPIVSLLEEIEQRWDPPEPPHAVFVYGLEKSIGESREFSPVFLRLNHDRDLFRRSVPAPLLLWVTDYALDCIVRGAPDFWAWRSGVYEFPTRREQWQREAMDGAYRPEPTLASLDLDEKRSEIARIEGLLRSAEELPRRGRRAWQIEAGMAFQLGILYESVGQWGHAYETFKKALQLYERLGDIRERAVTMGKIADILQARGDLDEALRIRREEELPVYERLGAVRDLLVGRTNLAIDLLYRDAPGDREEARRLLRQALDAARLLRIPEADQIEEILKKAEES